MARLTDPATRPFQNVLSAGVIPSMRAVKWLSNPQKRQARATSRADSTAARPPPPVSIIDAAKIPLKATHPVRVR